MNEEVAWDSERRLWTGGAARYRQLVDFQCVMAFPAPAGIMRFDAIMNSIDKMPRWWSVEMSDKFVTNPAKDITVLAYKATARREGEKPYEAFCTSTYCCFEGGLRLVHDQQSPA